jgi:hypothetical protein
MGSPALASSRPEVVTADGEVRIANACANPDLFWALKGGGGGFGVVTRVTLRTHALPEFFGGVFTTIKASSDEAYRRLISKIIEFYAQALFNPHWGEQLVFAPGRVLSIFMVLQGLDQHEAEATWRPFFEWISASGTDLNIVFVPRITSEPARRFWDPAFLKQAPGLVISDDRPGAAADNIFWAGNLGETGRVGMPTNPSGSPNRCSQTINASDWPTHCSRRRSIGPSSFTSTRGLRGEPPRRSRRPEIRP